MDALLNKVAGSAGVKADKGESIEQTMKEKAIEEAIEGKVEQIAGKKVAEDKKVQKGIEKVADIIGDKMSGDKKESGGGGVADLAKMAGGLLK